MNGKEMGKAAAKIYELLWNGEYIAPNGRRCAVQGDTSKIWQAIGLTRVQRALLNYQCMIAKLPGTRQIRRNINHLIFSSRIVYGLPIFMTVTPSERHSCLAIRLTRYRRSDPAIQHGALSLTNGAATILRAYRPQTTLQSEKLCP